MANQKSLKMDELKNVHLIDASDFDQFVREVYKQREYSFQADEEVGNDTEKLYQDITKEVDDEDSITEFKKTGRYSCLSRSLLEDLCRQGLIVPGDYLIQLSY